MSEVHGGDITKRTLEALQAYDWPGDVRELQNVDFEKLAREHFQLSSRTMSRRTFGRH